MGSLFHANTVTLGTKIEARDSLDQMLSNPVARGEDCWLAGISFEFHSTLDMVGSLQCELYSLLMKGVC